MTLPSTYTFCRSADVIAFLKSKAPIGARDMITKHFMEEMGVRSFFSGCMTLFLQIRNPQPIESREDTIYMTDVFEDHVRLLPEHIVKKSRIVTHQWAYGVRTMLINQERFIDAQKRLEKYSRAKIVITGRIHAALPCVAMGTPVVFFNAPKMPGGGATSTHATERVIGLVDLFHTINLFNLTNEQAKEKLAKFNWRNPPRNPNLGLRMQRVSSMWFILRKKQAIYESARRYGMFPLTPSWLTKEKHIRVFHIIHDDHNNGKLNWHQWRCIESILFHHPTSRLLVHSNTIQQSTFDVLTEVGFKVTVMKYKLSKLIEELPFKESFKQFYTKSDDAEKITRGYGWLKLLSLYTHGGIYLSENTIVLKTIDAAQKNVLSLDSESNVIPWMLNFERNHKFLRDALKVFPTTYKGDVKPDEGKALLTKVAQ